MKLPFSSGFDAEDNDWSDSYAVDLCAEIGPHGTLTPLPNHF